ncbi:hypothetical protein A4G20_09480 [Pasteurellaceae bacterium RH1A]|nr:hypothetical protein A4G20_09480 [Pasteurellaceae bacterium RH1A]
MNLIDQGRRKWLSLGGIVLGASLLPTNVLAKLATPKPLTLRLYNANTGERLVTNFHNGSKFVSSELSKLNHIMRDRRNNQVRRIDPNLFMRLYQVQRRLGLKNPEITLLSGYRSAQSNASLRRNHRGVASNSYHIRGQAMDFRIASVSTAKIRNAALSLSNGGVGYYPRSNFVHIDTGPDRSWRGV